MVCSLGQSIWFPHALARLVVQQEVKVGEVEGLLGLSAIELLGCLEVFEVLVICPDLKFVLPLLEQSDDSQHLLVMKYCSSMFSGHKLVLCTPTFKILKHVCMPSSCIPNKSHLALLKHWGPCKLLSEVHTFLSTVGVLRNFVKNFAHCANNLIKLTPVGVLFKFGPDQINALYEDIFCCWGAISKIVTDNSTPILKAIAYLAKKYNLHYIRVSGYNKHANNIVEQPHFDICQALLRLLIVISLITLLLDTTFFQLI
ncbi:hypothetical protein J132_05785 [Termitomyces sp. J132]|nr:hypothetical protein J132_05785 [Termitomyces sp. J132]